VAAQLLLLDGQGRVLVNAIATGGDQVAPLAGRLQTQLNMGGATLYPGQNLIVGYVAPANIKAMETVEGFQTATPVWKPILRTGSVESQGDAKMKADVFRSATGLDGTGVKVGVLSDSVSQVNGGIADSQATGDLPATVQVLKDGQSGDTDEGRAMLEIIHDVAPGAALAFNSAGGGPQAFATGIQNLDAAGAKVIVDDVGYLDSPFFNDGVVAQAADSVFTKGDLYVSAAGNEADKGFQTAWKGVTATIGSGAGQVTAPSSTSAAATSARTSPWPAAT